MTFATMIDGPDGAFGAYVAKPAQSNGASLVVIQEIFGVNEAMRDVADKYAALGYTAIVPDLFWRIKPGISITDKTPEEMAQAFDLYSKFNVETGIKDIQTTLDFARTSSAKVGTVGYCLGGFLAYLTASRTDTDASVSFYGVSIDSQIDQMQHVRRPLLLHIASEDKFVSKEAQKVILDAIGDKTQNIGAHIEGHVYQGLDHAFARPGGEHFDAAGANLANERTAAFFKKHLL
jgi:carboxymethylenebutenolidase